MQPRDTERLTFRPVTMDDAEILHQLNHAPGVMEFLERVPPPIKYLRTKTIPERIRMGVEYPGFGMWVAHLKGTGEFVGRYGLRPNSPHDGDVEIGYRVLPAYWGKGLGSEGALEILRYAFEDLRVERFVAITMAVNIRSRRVMERIGLTYVRTFHEEFEDPLPGTEHGEVEYAMTRAEWSDR
ncbi:MAG: GNAT family N-acetyltransferase [Thermomicrobiales bacterium]|nr:GNAT family N-acetyltransferase [Thermomicrobiales bacterium]MCO5226020.1 GNAT family N-acetyltransferase [Thermomicrobiales bacterium]MCO5229111.1 GNAT family N-acetyltransferase [Thermomicrobiales bacterium]